MGLVTECQGLQDLSIALRFQTIISNLKKVTVGLPEGSQVLSSAVLSFLFGREPN